MTSIEGYCLTLTTNQCAKPEFDIATMVESYSVLMFRVAHSVLRSSTEAEDVVQDAFVRVLEHRSNLASVRDIRVWLVRIVWNLAIDRKRRMRPEQMEEAFAQALAARCVPADQALAESQRMQSALAGIERLPRKEREVLLLSTVEELGISEISAVVGRSESAVRALLFRARTRLRERLDQKKGGVR